jgi:hypothetical protein
MIAGATASQAAVAVDDLTNTRRLTGAIFMVLPPGRVFLRIAIVVAAVR